MGRSTEERCWQQGEEALQMLMCIWERFLLRRFPQREPPGLRAKDLVCVCGLMAVAVMSKEASVRLTGLYVSAVDRQEKLTATQWDEARVLARTWVFHLRNVYEREGWDGVDGATLVPIATGEGVNADIVRSARPLASSLGIATEELLKALVETGPFLYSAVVAGTPPARRWSRKPVVTSRAV